MHSSTLVGRLPINQSLWQGAPSIGLPRWSVKPSWWMHVDSRFSQNSGVFDSGFSAKIHGEMGIVQGGFAFAKQREIALLPRSPRSKGSRRSIEMGKMQVTNKFHHSWDPNCSFKSLRNAKFHVKLLPRVLYINRKAYHKWKASQCHAIHKKKNVMPFWEDQS